jgi:hypothetical protein
MYLLICILLEFEKKKKILILLQNEYLKSPVMNCICRKGGNPIKLGILFSWRKKSFINFKSDKRALAYAGHSNSM